MMIDNTVRTESVAVEALEPRQLFSAVIKHHHSDWLLLVRPDDRRADATIVVRLTPDQASVQVVINDGPPAVFPLASAAADFETAHATRAVSWIRVEGGGGNDHLTVDDAAGAIRAAGVTLAGGRGDDVLTAGPRSAGEVLDGGPGNDQLVGGAGAVPVPVPVGEWWETPTNHLLGDTLRGGAGDDVLTGGAGMDDLDCGDGNDTLVGGGEDDTLVPRLGDDRVTGGAGADEFYVGRHPERRPGLVTDKADEDVNVRLDHPRHFSNTISLDGVPTWDIPFGF